MPKELPAIPNRRRKDVVVTIRPYYSPDPNGPYYEQYCRQRLMLHVDFRQMSDLLGENDTYAAAYIYICPKVTIHKSVSFPWRCSQIRPNWLKWRWWHQQWGKLFYCHTSRCPDYQGVLIIKVSWLSRCPDYQGVLIIKVSWLSRCPDYQGVLIIKVAWLSRCPDYQGQFTQ